MPRFIVNGYPIDAATPDPSWTKITGTVNEYTTAGAPAPATPPAPRLIYPAPGEDPPRVCPSGVQAANSWAAAMAQVQPQAGLDR